MGASDQTIAPKEGQSLATESRLRQPLLGPTHLGALACILRIVKLEANGATLVCSFETKPACVGEGVDRLTDRARLHLDHFGNGLERLENLVLLLFIKTLEYTVQSPGGGRKRLVRDELWAHID